MRLSPQAGWRAVGWAIPLTVLLFGFIVPIGYLFVVSLRTPVRGQLLGAGVSLDNYVAVLGDSFYQSIILQTLGVGIVITGACLLVGYPLAMTMVRMPSRWRWSILMLLVFPLMMSNVIRAYGWIAILGRRGVVNSALLGAGVIERPMPLLHSTQAIVIALLTILLPYTVVSIYNTLTAIDKRYAEASQSLGTSPLWTFVRVTWPLSAPGVAAGLSIVWLLALSAYVTISLIGGARNKLLVSMVYDSAMAFQWPRAAALAFVLLAVGLVGAGAIFAILRPNRARGYG